MSGIEDLIGDDVWLAIDQAKARRRHARRIASALTFALRWSPDCIAYGGLATIYTREAIAMLRPTIPGGWVVLRLRDRDAFIVMPLWLAWLSDAWNARFHLFRLAIRLGVWTVQEGGYYVEGRVTAPAWLRRAWWCFLHDRDVYAPTWDGSVRAGRIGWFGLDMARLGADWSVVRLYDIHSLVVIE